MLCATAAGLFLAAVAHSQTTMPAITGYQDFIHVIEKASRWLYGIILAVAVLFVLVGAWKFLKSGGDPKDVESAKNQVLYAVIAVIVAVFSKSLITAASSFFTGP
jgi:prolipoprotein diacylglyceryltransferase